MQRRRVAVVVALAGAWLLGLPVAASGAPHTTVSRTIQDCDGDNLLEFAPGEEHLEVMFGVQPPTPPADDCAEDEGADTPRLPRRASLLNFLHMSDFQIVDEEGPARVEFFDFTQRPPGPTPQDRPSAYPYNGSDLALTEPDCCHGYQSEPALGARSRHGCSRVHPYG